jgi:hypothetical protein
MFMTVTTFAVVAIIFLILSFFIDEVWKYYVPTALIVLSIWLKSIQSEWDSDKYFMPTTKMEPSAAAGWVSMISIVYGIISLIIGNFISLAICIIIFLLALTMKFPHPYL